MAIENSGARDPVGSELVKEDAVYADIVAEFVEGLGDRLTAMNEALRASDFESLRIAAHRLRGSGGGYGYPVLSEGAAQLEQHARGAIAERCRQAVEELEKLCERIVVDPVAP